jgi:hypothetical protein
MPPLKLNDIQQAEFSVGPAERVRQVEQNALLMALNQRMVMVFN